MPWHETVIYETHVKGLTARHPEVPRRGQAWMGEVPQLGSGPSPDGEIPRRLEAEVEDG